MVLKADQERVKTLLTETITLLCKNGLHYQSEFSIEGLIAVTVDNQEIFLVSLKETFHISPSCEQPKKECPDPFLKVFQPKLLKAPDDDFDSDSAELTSISGNQEKTGIKCMDTTHTAPSLITDLPKHGMDQEIKDLDDISLPLVKAHSNTSSTNFVSTLPNEPDPSKTGKESYKALQSYKLKKDFQSDSSKERSSLTLINAADSSKDDNMIEMHVDLRHVKKEILEDDDDDDDDDDSAEDHMPNYSNSLMMVGTITPPFLSNLSTQNPQKPLYMKKNVGIFQPSALQTSAMNLNMSTNPIEPWPSGRRSVRKGGSSSGKRHNCQICNKSFTFASALTHHENNIHGRRPHPFKCFICGKGFWNQRSMRGHMTSKHLMQTEFCCPICHKEYAYKVSLRDHMKLYHNMTL